MIGARPDWSDAHTVVADTADGDSRSFEADAILLSTGSRPRIPTWADPTATAS